MVPVLDLSKGVFLSFLLYGPEIFPGKALYCIFIRNIKVVVHPSQNPGYCPMQWNKKPNCIDPCSLSDSKPSHYLTVNENFSDYR